jgi:hypothetical protein
MINKSLLALVFLFTLTLFSSLTSCKKDKDDEPTEAPIKPYLGKYTMTGQNIHIWIKDNNVIEYGSEGFETTKGTYEMISTTRIKDTGIFNGEGEFSNNFTVLNMASFEWVKL